ncbi:hypothetical protein LCGC14_1248160 [marine sediment metagenome]|uniref:Transposase IS891/IS1136/IS1341 domain-containing protein n=1 Tax=marine sediment metagenome TaxID=412755 RepID=A0A0F9L7J8_9ZZZZ
MQPLFKRNIIFFDPPFILISLFVPFYNRYYFNCIKLIIFNKILRYFEDFKLTINKFYNIFYDYRLFIFSLHEEEPLKEKFIKFLLSFNFLSNRILGSLTMRLTEQIQLPLNKRLSYLCHLAKNLFNLANYYVRQELFYLESWLRYHDLWYMLKNKTAYQQLPSQTAQQVLKLVDHNWKSFFRAMAEWKCHPEKFLNRPKPPKYKTKNGEYTLIFTNQQCHIREGYLYFPKKTSLSPIKTRIQEPLHQVRIIPEGLYYLLEIIYEKQQVDLGLNKGRIVGIDIGLNNIVTLVNNAGLQPAIIKGGVVKSVNQFYNKRIAHYRSKKDKQKIPFETKQLKRLTQKRNNLIKDKFHKISRSIINYCMEHDFGSIIIGYNPLWKQKIKLGKKTTQQFVQLPFRMLIHYISYKAELIGIEVRIYEESYTSICSFLDQEPIQKHSRYSGRRISRGLFQSQNGTLINADVNAGYNIIRKALPNAPWVDGIEGVGFHPYCLTFSKGVRMTE